MVVGFETIIQDKIEIAHIHFVDDVSGILVVLTNALFVNIKKLQLGSLEETFETISQIKINLSVRWHRVFVEADIFHVR